jgi:inosose dehydratase
MRISVERLLFRERPLETFLDYVAGLGVDGVEFSEYEISRLSERGSLARRDIYIAVRERGLQISGIYWSEPFHEMGERMRIVEHARRLAAEYRNMNCWNVIIGPPKRITLKTDAERIKVLSETAETLKAAAAAFRDHGVRASLHNHYDTTIETEDELSFILERIDEEILGFCPDTAHLLLAGMDPAQIIKRYLNRITYVHLKDVAGPLKTGEREARWFEKTAELGRGVIDFPPIIRLLRSGGRAEWLVIEQDTSGLNPELSTKISLDYLKAIITG